MTMMATVFGLQRSGTNFVEMAIRNNFTGVRISNTDRQWIWKHSFGDGNNGYHAGIPPEKMNAKGKKYLLIHKHPYAWMESVCTRNVDIAKRYGKIVWNNLPTGHNEDLAMKCTNMNIKEMVNLYNAYYEFWLEREKSHYIFVINYEQMVASEDATRATFDAMQKHFGWTKGKNQYVIPDKVGQSDKFTPDRRTKYTRYILNKLSWAQVQYINQNISPVIKQRMEYPWFETVEQYNNHYRA